MSKKLVVDAIESQFPNRAQADRAVDAVVDAVAKLVKGGERIEFRGFGSFSKKRGAERVGRNPRTGESIKIAARDRIVFKASKTS